MVWPTLGSRTAKEQEQEWMQEYVEQAADVDCKVHSNYASENERTN